MTGMRDDEQVEVAAEQSAESARRLVLVAGSGRSGTSTMSGILRLVGLHVPQPEVRADATNPRGFGEPQWVVDLHAAMLDRARVHPSDARPAAWGHAADVVTEPVRRQLDRWLGQQFTAAARDTSELVIKDPRLAWFLPLWTGAAERSQASAAVITMLRPPAEVVASKVRSYGGPKTDSNRLAAWVNMMLHTEYATRGGLRAFVSYHALLDDWTTAVHRMGETLQVRGVRDASADQIRNVHLFVDPALRRVSVDWSDVEAPAPLRELADESWEALSHLVDPTADDADLRRRLDQLRDAYMELYLASEQLAMSSVIAARRTKPPGRDIGAPDSSHGPEPTSMPVPATTTAQPALTAPSAQPVRTGTRRLDRLSSAVPHAVRARIPARLRRRVRAGLARLQGDRR